MYDRRKIRAAVIDQPVEILFMDNADNAVNGIAVDRQSGKTARAEDFHNFRNGRIHRDGDNVHTRR